MVKVNYLSLASLFAISIAIASGAANAGPITYTTANGAVFTRNDFSSTVAGWTAPNGVTWSACVGPYINHDDSPDGGDMIVNSEATRACAKLGGDLPTLDQYRIFFNYFRDSLGNLDKSSYTDFAALFPVCPFGLLWSKNAVGQFGRIVKGWDPFGDAAKEDRALPVRCVSTLTTK